MYLSLVPDPAPFFKGVGGIVPTTHSHFWERVKMEERERDGESGQDSVGGED